MSEALAFTPQLSTSSPLTEMIYGPVLSRRLGLSLGVNPLGAVKACSFDCVYCNLGPSALRMNQIKKDAEFPSVAQIEETLRSKLREIILSGETLKSITVSGNGEPTLYPNFSELSEMLAQVKSEMYPKASLTILTNGAHIDSRRMVQALDLYDLRMIKLDAGSDLDFKKINSPLIRANSAKIIEGARRLKDCIVQAMFVQGAVDNTTNESVDEWLEVVGIIQPKEVHIYTLQTPGTRHDVLPASEDALYTVASKLKRRTQLEARVFPCDTGL